MKDFRKFFCASEVFVLLIYFFSYFKIEAFLFVSPPSFSHTEVTASFSPRNHLMLHSTTSSSSSASPPEGVASTGNKKEMRNNDSIKDSFFKIEEKIELIPPMIISNVPGTWAYDTMSRRIRDEILTRIYDENHLNNENIQNDPVLKEAKSKLDIIQKELADSNVKSNLYMAAVGKESDPDYGTWKDIIAPYEGVKWLDCPWLVTEFYFYRKIVDVFNYFDTSYDPFRAQKLSGLQTSIPFTIELFNRYSSIKEENKSEKLRFAIFASLWGNKMDLSLWPSESHIGDTNKEATLSNVLEANSENLLCDDYIALENHLFNTTKSHKRVDIIVDNAGFELMTDLLLANALIDTKVAQEVVFHVKGHPTFVSDALESDLRETIFELGANGLMKAEDWESYLTNGEWKIQSHCYWAQPFPFWKMPLNLYENLETNSHLSFLKGDANYRRLLGDRTWKLNESFPHIAGSFPSPICALRTLKAELGCGMEEKATTKAKEQDPQDWMVTGKYGVLQFTTPSH